MNARIYGATHQNAIKSLATPNRSRKNGAHKPTCDQIAGDGYVKQTSSCADENIETSRMGPKLVRIDLVVC